MRISSQEISKNQDDFNSSIESANEEQLKSTRMNAENISDELLRADPVKEVQVKQGPAKKTQATEINHADKIAEAAYEEGTKTKSKIRQVFFSILATCSNIITKFKATKLGKFLTSTILGHSITILFASLTLAGLLGPVGPLVLTICITTLVGVALGVTAETIKTRSFRKLVKENNLLVQNGENLRKQEIMLEKPLLNLRELLETDLYLASKPYRKPPHVISYSYEMGKNMWNTGVIYIANILSISVKITSAATGNIPALLSAIGNGTVTIGNIAYSGYSAHQLANVSIQLKNNINLALDNQNIEKYRNLHQLKRKCKIQHIQTEALIALTKDGDIYNVKEVPKKFLRYKVAAAKLIEDKDYMQLNEEGKIIRLRDEASTIQEKEILHFINDNKKKDMAQARVSLPVTGWLKSVGKDVLRVLNPLYEPPEIAPQSLLTVAATSNQQNILIQEPALESRPIDIALANYPPAEKGDAIVVNATAPASLQQATVVTSKMADKTSPPEARRGRGDNYSAQISHTKTIGKSHVKRNRGQ